MKVSTLKQVCEDMDKMGVGLCIGVGAGRLQGNNYPLCFYLPSGGIVLGISDDEFYKDEIVLQKSKDCLNEVLVARSEYENSKKS